MKHTARKPAPEVSTQKFFVEHRYEDVDKMNISNELTTRLLAREDAL
jgi:hypothetical protein